MDGVFARILFFFFCSRRRRITGRFVVYFLCLLFFSILVVLEAYSWRCTWQLGYTGGRGSKDKTHHSLGACVLFVTRCPGRAGRDRALVRDANKEKALAQRDGLNRMDGWDLTSDGLRTSRETSSKAICTNALEGD